MNNKKLILICSVLIAGALFFYSFKNTNEARKITIFRQYLSTNADYGNMIIITYPDGKIKKQMLLQNKHVNYEMNDKMFTQHLTELVNSGLEIKHVTSSGGADLTITTFILE